MHSRPTIDFEEFCYYTTQTEEQNGFQTVERQHPEFGFWKESYMNLGHIKVYQHVANLKETVNVLFEDTDAKNHVHHCISVGGEMNAHFVNAGLSAKLSSKKFHQVFVPENEYLLGMGKSFVNVHIEIERTYYAGLLSDSEKWSAEVRRKILENELYYPGEFSLTLPMMRTIQEIFNSPLSGSLKRLLIEAKVHELVALQLNGCIGESLESGAKTKDIFVAIRDFIDTTFLQEHSLKSIAREFAINEFALKKGFKEQFNTTVFDYILHKRMEHAQQLLLHSDKTIQQIGREIGYKYTNHFSAAFKSRFGVTPTALRG